MHGKGSIVLAAGVFLFVAFSVMYSYSRCGTSISENTSRSPDGRIYVCRAFSKINKVIAIDAGDRSSRRELARSEWAYDDRRGELRADFAEAPFKDTVFHIEGAPQEPPTFMLADYDPAGMPAIVFINGKTATENREYVFDARTATIVLRATGKNIRSYCILWHTPNGISSSGEMTDSERDLYAELESAWFVESSRRAILAEKEVPSLEFGEGSDTPSVSMRKTTDDERNALVDSMPVNVYKSRNKKSMGALSRETGISIRLPDTVSAGGKKYRRISTLLVEASVRGESLKYVEVTYSSDGTLSPSAISVIASGIPESEPDQYRIGSEVLGLAVPVEKDTFWSIVSGPVGNRDGYRAEVSCSYAWSIGKTQYRIDCSKNGMNEIESFLRELLR